MTEQTAPTSRTPLAELSREQLEAFAKEQRAAYDALREKGLKLDLTRGKPAPAQLDLSNELLSLPRGHTDASGTDVRNYGGLQGIAELREVFAELLGVNSANVVAGGNSSLSMMHDTLVDLLLHGGVDCPRPWTQEEKVTFVCPVPGYDRHFTLLESFGIEMVTVPMHDDGPDAEAVARLVAERPQHQGHVDRPDLRQPGGLGRTPGGRRPAGVDGDGRPRLQDLLGQRLRASTTSPTTRPRAPTSSAWPRRPATRTGRSCSPRRRRSPSPAPASRSSPRRVENVAWYLDHLAKGSIGPDKVNQLRHAQFFGSAQGVRDHMVRHREIIAPKFAEVDRVLTERLGGLGTATWTKPKGGYFVSLDVLDGTASRVVQLAKEAGHRAHPGGRLLPARQRPRRPEHPPRPDLPAAAGGHGRHGGRGHVRAARGGGAAAVPGLTGTRRLEPREGRSSLCARRRLAQD